MKEAMRTKNVLVMTLVIALFIGFVGQSKAQDGVWTSNGPYGGFIPALAVSPNYATDHTVYAGANDGRVYKTMDGGANWTAVSTGINTSELILALAISPNYSTDNTVFAGVNSRGVYKTTDDGENWTEVLSSSSARDTRSLAISPNYATDQTIFAGTVAGVFKSTDGGASWTAVNSGISSTFYMCYLAISPNYANDQTLYVGGMSSGGIYKSTDGGSSWTLVNSGMSVYSITISPNFSTDQTVYAGSSSGIYKTTDGGSSWTAVTTGIYGISSLATSPNYINDQTVYAGTGSGVYKTTDGGISWTAVNSGISDTPLNIRSLAISPDYMTDQTVFAGLLGGGVFKTTSGGSSWAANNTGISSASISSLAISAGYSDDHTIFAGSYNNGVYRTTDGGASWASINSGISDFNIYSLVISPDYETDSTVFAGSWGGGVYKTTDGGANWAAVNTGITSNEISSLAISPNYAADRTVFAGLYYGRAVCKTTDGGASWTAVLTGSSAVFSLAISPNYDSDFTVYVGTGSGVYKTTDGGTSWTAVNSGIPIKTISALAVSSDYFMDQTVYAGTSNNGLYKTTDGGASWVYSGPGGTIHSIAVSPEYATDQTVYVGTGSGGPHGGGPSQGIYKSTDGGASWTTMNSGLPTNLGSSSPTICISPDFATDQTVFAGTNGFSVYSYILSVNSPPVVSDIPDQTINEGESFATIALDDYVDDPDNTDAQMVWTHSGNVELTVSISAARVATIGIPNPDWSGSETITFTATDPGPLSDSDAATFTVNAVNDAPVVSGIPDQTIDEGDTFATIILDNYVADVDNADSEMVWSYSGNTELTVSIVDRVASIGIPDVDWNGSETITFEASDGEYTDSDGATFTVNAVNDAPVAKDDTASVDEDGAIVDATTVTGNDTGLGDGGITVSLIDDVDDGTLTLNTDGTYDYIPDPDFNGTDSFVYEVCDTDNDCDQATVTITVNPVNDPPVAVDDNYVATEDTPLEVADPGVLSNDFDVDGGALSVFGWDANSQFGGSVSMDAVGSFSYTPALGFVGDDSFTYTVSDGNGGFDTATVYITVEPANNPPTAEADGPYGVDEGGSVPVIASGSDPENDPLTFAWDLDNDGTFETPGQSVTFSAAALDGPSSHTIAVQVTDDGGLSDTDQTTVEVLNVAPTAIFANTSGAVNEGETATLVFSNQFDPSATDVAAGFRYSYDCTDDGTFELSDDPAASFVCHYPDNGTFTARGRIKDKDGDFTDYTAEVTVNNIAPSVGQIAAPLDPIQVNTEINASADFTDSGMLDTHTAVWDWGDTSTSPGTVNETNGSGSVTGSHTYTTPGVYTVKLTVTDDDGGLGQSEFRYVVIYDPEGGFVTGGGWINSPEGACQLTEACTGATGKANFGFVSKYKKGAEVPTGETEFQFKAGNLNFHSDSYEWLVVANHKAMYKGVGTINGAGNYGFMLSAIDEKLTPSTDVDLFRIKIWDKDNDDAIVYDNQMGAEDDEDPTTEIGGGNIVIHK
jgi:photosystem II stability/assembly factor-like uncharacterized protein